MKLWLFLFLIISIFISFTLGIDTDLWAFVLSTSDKFENFRHSVNPLLIYNFLKKNGIPDERIILGLSEFHACTPYSYYPGELYLKQGANILTSCNSDVNLDYKDSDFHNFQILDILKGRSSQLMNNFRKIDSNKHSRIIIMITSHGGENFIKVRGKSVILSDELNRALNEMYIKERYKEILFIVDTCEGGSLFDFVDVPNVYFVASSSRDQKSHSYSFDDKYMGPTSDKFHFKLHEILQKIHEKKSFKSAIHSIFMDIKSQREFLETDVEIINKIQREIIFEEFFGNYQTKHHKNKKYNFTISSSDTKHSELIENFKDTKNNFVEMNSIRNKIDEEVLEIKTFSENHFTTSNPDTDKTIRNQITSELINLKNIGSRALIFFTIIYTIINLLKK